MTKVVRNLLTLICCSAACQILLEQMAFWLNWHSIFVKCRKSKLKFCYKSVTIAPSELCGQREGQPSLCFLRRVETAKQRSKLRVKAWSPPPCCLKFVTEPGGASGGSDGDSDEAVVDVVPADRPTGHRTRPRGGSRYCRP